MVAIIESDSEVKVTHQKRKIITYIGKLQIGMKRTKY